MAKRRRATSKAVSNGHGHDPSLIRTAMMRQMERRYIAEGQVALPAVPSLLEHYIERISTLFGSLGRTMDSKQRESLRELLAEKLEEAFRVAPQSNVFIRYKIERTSGSPISYGVASALSSIPSEYDYWVKTRSGPLFGPLPDAKLMAIARTLGPPAEIPVLDVGAGTGRNTLPLARAGHPTVALELAPALADVLREDLELEKLDVPVVTGDVLDEALGLPRAPYGLAVVAEVVPHLRDVDELTRLFTRLAGLLRPGGTLLLSAFLTKDGYHPDQVEREMAQVLWSAFFTREELSAATAGLPFEPVSDESVLEFEQAHLPPEGWPPTTWFVSWASGADAFDLWDGRAPIDLRWLVFRRTS
jgi:2-polyprenyl-3-methyl-5-hydroxy-6-metoxy-1,4-benzoquinol methylase